MENKLIYELNKVLHKHNLGCVVKKETNTLLHCYLYDLDDCKTIGKISDYRGCEKLDVTYKKSDLVRLIENNSLRSFAEKERENFGMARRLRMLRE